MAFSQSGIGNGATEALTPRRSREGARETLMVGSDRIAAATMTPTTPGRIVTTPNRNPPVALHRRQKRRMRVSDWGATERKIVTILFADVTGSTQLSRRIELEDWWHVMSRVFEDMCEGIELFGGWVEGFTGDGVMAVFETEQPDAHAHRACAAARWMQAAMQRASEEWRERGVVLSVRIGVNSGEVLTGVLGRRYGRHYTANGYAVALAKRIEGLAIPGRICLSETTAAIVGDTDELHDLGRFDVKGADAPVRAFELIGPR